MPRKLRKQKEATKERKIHTELKRIRDMEPTEFEKFKTALQALQSQGLAEEQNLSEYDKYWWNRISLEHTRNKRSHARPLVKISILQKLKSIWESFVDFMSVISTSAKH